MHLVRFTLIALMVCTLMGCASTSAEKEEKVSTLPWNTPEKWERSGPAAGGGVGY